ncbi:MAG TPA: glucoamylase family protein [Granulicella sp.]|nr:glucoamylase family protein [Granulicella sp.]
MAASSKAAMISEQAMHPTAPAPEIPVKGLPERPDVTEAELRAGAEALIAQWEMLGPARGDASRGGLPERLKRLSARLKERLAAAKSRVTSKDLTPELELLESTRMLEAALISADAAQATFAKVPHIRLKTGEDLPRVMHLVEAYVVTAKGIWSAESLAVFVGEGQRPDPLLLEEVRVIPQALKLAELEYILDRADEAFALAAMPPIEQSPFSAPLHSLRRLNQYEWRELLEALIVFDAILREDPTGMFARMEAESRAAYHIRVAELAKNADLSEVGTAQMALELARKASRETHFDERRTWRSAHIGYFLFAEGLKRLQREIGYNPPLFERLQQALRQWNEEFYILGIFTMSLLLIVALIAPLVPHHDPWAVIFALLLALLPATQGGVDLINSTVSSLLHAEALPKLDFSKGVPPDAMTLVAIPTLLLHEKQVRGLFEELEARYLANQDPNIHFGLLTDLADSVTRPHDDDRNPLVRMAVRAIDDLNAKYRGSKGGAFVLLHRHRVYNSRQGVWMGWERKRGKLLDLNKLLLRVADSFPVKTGPMEALKNIRYVITLDSDTQLPRGTAARMVGTLAHPLNQAIIDPELRMVTRGYGILQPRVGVSVASASRSRMAALYSGETGFDIYTRAVSDVYQDLFGEGIFAGKGIYEVSVLHDVLDKRFPRNSLLSHDLIEGAYTRAGLVTDIEIIDDYPSHYSAHMRRKHRWVRGDWQIAQWMFSQVPDEEGRLVENPISTISRWKIFDNLRRSLIEPVTFLLLVAGWFVLTGGPLYWTVATLVLLLLPALVQLGFDLGRALLKLSVPAARDGVRTFWGSAGLALLNLAFLPHHMMLSLDAILRSMARRFISGKYLLEWETAAQAEAGETRRTPLDWYLRLSPIFSVVIAALLVWLHPRAVTPAAPVLVLWACAPLISKWLNSPPQQREAPLRSADAMFLRHQALATWRYFAEFGDAQNHWLIPDNVEEHGLHQVRKLSPTNLGMLLNARQAAYEFGFVTLPELTEATLGTLATYERLEKQRGHIYNWYDIETLRAIPPFIVSAVDSGNLAAGFYALHAGALDLLQRPVLEKNAFAGLELVRKVSGWRQPRKNGRVASGRSAGPIRASVRTRVRELMETRAWGGSGVPVIQAAAGDVETVWPVSEAARRETALATFVEQYVPWLLPQFDAVFSGEGSRTWEGAPLYEAPVDKVPSLAGSVAYVRELEERLEVASRVVERGSELAAAIEALRALLPGAGERLSRLEADVSTIATLAEHHAEAMEYGFLLVEERQLLSIGYDGQTGELHSACYDLLASEARIASFLAVAKNDIPQQSWFRLDRSHALVKGRPCLLSWTGTMFEYLMPALWMRNFPDTLIARSLEAAAAIQSEHVRGIPWGISESGFAAADEPGRYGYQAWGIPKLALKYGAEDGPVISPYSTFLALPLIRSEAIANLRKMVSLGWVGPYGFYEAADYTKGRAAKGQQPELVRSWMAHHQGMSLLAVTNLLCGNVFQRWFHANARVRAAELLLHERPLSKDTLKTLSERSLAEA